jgi:hypothetical protein
MLDDLEGLSSIILVSFGWNLDNDFRGDDI